MVCGVLTPSDSIKQKVVVHATSCKTKFFRGRIQPHLQSIKNNETDIRRERLYFAVRGRLRLIRSGRLSPHQIKVMELYGC